MLYKPAIVFGDGRSVNIYTRIPIFVCFAGRLVNTPRVACHPIMAIDVYTHYRFSESLGSRLGGPGQKALQAMNEFTLFVDFCRIPLSKTCAFDVPAKNL